jgi:hypothetical protein
MSRRKRIHMEKRISEIVKDAIEELNEQLDEKISYDKGLCLIGNESVIDSMSFVTLMTIIEEIIQDELDMDVEIVSDRAFSSERSPFRTIETLEGYLLDLVTEG